MFNLVSGVQIWNWSPKPVDESKLDNPEYDTMSENLKTRILKSMDKNYVWADCAGRNPADRYRVTTSETT